MKRFWAGAEDLGVRQGSIASSVWPSVPGVQVREGAASPEGLGFRPSAEHTGRVYTCRGRSTQSVFRCKTICTRSGSGKGIKAGGDGSGAGSTTRGEKRELPAGKRNQPPWALAKLGWGVWSAQSHKPQVTSSPIPLCTSDSDVVPSVRVFGGRGPSLQLMNAQGLASEASGKYWYTTGATYRKGVCCRGHC